ICVTNGRRTVRFSQTAAAILPGILHESDDASPQLRPGLISIEAQGLHDRRVTEAEQEGRSVGTIDVLVESPGRDREHVLVFPVEPLLANNRVAGALDYMEIR